MERDARLQKLEIPLDEVNELWMQENGPKHVKKLAEHYGIFKDIFNGGFFLPVVPLDINYEYEGEFVNPVYRGNRISPFEAHKQPEVSFDPAEGSLWTLILTNPDGHLQDNESEYLHWLIGNIPEGDVSKGDVLCDYLQPFPARGTGFHRFVFVLMQQDGRLDFSGQQRSPQCHSLEERTFKTADFLSQHQGHLTPKGLSFFQSEYDDSVRDIFHKTLDMREPSFEYAHPPFYHPPQEAYPYKQPFDRYFDRYRDKKDLAEEVMKMKMAMISPFTAYERPKYPLIHRAVKGTRATWINRREEKMHRRLEQFKDLP
ncbi:hypothetical protein CAPTEDRAFT_150382 [Capitella teleta]|uniref:Large ribosomal subunit protein mL38 n=1 Tax=Capitella teleta TaxID=283909 RepID=R7TAA9_CAPTE|nr:hypothetical protein CAPTEDRAFT_150382 [Capitella teleta]|eukprot:ELT90673.1 hypothetical protein CAPTEDRAFT_150382 [Capitella teleta]